MDDSVAHNIGTCGHSISDTSLSSNNPLKPRKLFMSNDHDLIGLICLPAKFKQGKGQYGFTIKASSQVSKSHIVSKYQPL
jgi:hypothetical protein